MKKEKEQYKIPQSFAEALMLAAKQQKKIERLQLALKSKDEEIIQLSTIILTEMKPKVSYVNTILSSKETVTTAQIAQDYGQSAKAFDALLGSLGIQCEVGGQWFTRAENLSNGYVDPETASITRRDGSAGFAQHMRWTQKGRLFLYEELKKHEILPLIEK